VPMTNDLRQGVRRRSPRTISASCAAFRSRGDGLTAWCEHALLPRSPYSGTKCHLDDSCARPGCPSRGATSSSAVGCHSSPSASLEAVNLSSDATAFWGGRHSSNLTGAGGAFGQPALQPGRPLRRTVQHDVAGHARFRLYSRCRSLLSPLESSSTVRCTRISQG